MNVLQLEGQRFGRLLILNRSNNNRHRDSLWSAICDCGNTCVAIGSKLRSGRKKSCGCLRVRNTNVPSQMEICKLLDYNPKTGIFKWRENRHPFIKKGDIAGTIKKDGGTSYINIMIRGRLYSAHRLAFMYITGSWPVNLVDHKDGNGINNKWDNLRDSSLSQNSANSAIHKNNTSGYKGVSWHKKVGRWCAKIRKDGRTYNLGVFSDPQEAHAAYIVKAQELFGEFARAK